MASVDGISAAAARSMTSGSSASGVARLAIVGLYGVVRPLGAMQSGSRHHVADRLGAMRAEMSVILLLALH